MNTDMFVYTIGYEKSSIDDFAVSLESYKVGKLLDIRANPYSSQKEYCGDDLNSRLRESGIKYESLPSFGMPFNGRQAAAQNKLSRAWNIYWEMLDNTKTNHHILLDMIKSDKIAFMCMEKNPSKCHRHILTEYLKKYYNVGYRHIDVIPDISSSNSLF